MDRVALLSDLLITAADCVGQPDDQCTYNIFISPGKPPADCTYIAGYWDGVVPERYSDNCLMPVRETFRIVMNRCCLVNNGESFEPLLENEDGTCFINAFGTLADCLMCNANRIIKTYIRGFENLAVQASRPEDMVQGGCYGGEIEISFQRLNACCE